MTINSMPDDASKISYYIHPTAVVEPDAVIGEGARIWHFGHVRNGARIGKNVITGKGVYVDQGVTIGDHSRIQNGVSLFNGVMIDAWCFIGPHAVFTNDMRPRAGARCWEIVPTRLELGMSIGAGAIIRCGLTLGAFSMTGAGAIVTRSIAPFHLALGTPARTVEMLCACGETKLPLKSPPGKLLRDCCEKKMQPEFYQCAEAYIKTYFK
jgi:acetyltransferase-like isoleucine patch superfamily enzyme